MYKNFPEKKKQKFPKNKKKNCLNKLTSQYKMLEKYFRTNTYFPYEMRKNTHKNTKIPLKNRQNSQLVCFKKF